MFLRLQKGIETAFPDVITLTVDHVFSLLLPHNDINHLQLLKNLLFLVQWERKTESFKKKTTRLDICQFGFLTLQGLNHILQYNSH